VELIKKEARSTVHPFNQLLKSRCLLLLLAISGFACQTLPETYPIRVESRTLTLSDQQDLRSQLSEHFGTPVALRVPLLTALKQAHVVAGQTLFKSNCAKCHGVLGNGDGLWLDARRGPRDFTRGAIKFSSTGVTPTRQDIKRIIRRGLPRTRMPAFPELDDSEIESITNYIQFIAIRGVLELRLIAALKVEGKVDNNELEEELLELSKMWKAADQLTIVPKIENPKASAKTVARGRQLFLSERTKCFDCHGRDARGRGPGGVNLKDDWGNSVEPSNLTIGEHRGGSRPIDLYWRIHGGIPGTPMPAMKNVLKASEIWDLVHYLESMEGS
jgi:mono/diheme cytochrome c family protein